MQSPAQPGLTSDDCFTPRERRIGHQSVTARAKSRHRQFDHTFSVGCECAHGFLPIELHHHVSARTE